MATLNFIVNSDSNRHLISIMVHVPGSGPGRVFFPALTTERPRSPEFLAQRAESWRLALDGPTSMVPGESTVGGGSLPGETLPTSLLSIDASEMPGGANALAANLRRGDPPIIGRIDAERVLLDPRTVPQDLDDVMVRGIFHAL